jgi:hypothetical protein
MSRQIVGSLEYPAGTNFTGVIEARHIEGNTVTVPQSISEFPVTNALYDFTLENGSYQFSIRGIIDEGSTEESRVKLGLGIVNDGTPIDLLTLLSLSEPLSSPVEDLIKERGLPSGGTTGQHLAKLTDNDYETEWVDALDEAPIDGQQYARQDGGWSVVTGGGGAETFTELTDTPNNYATFSGQVVRVNVGETGLEFSNLTKTDVGLDQVDNTSDLNKPISTATQAALEGKEDDLGLPATDGQVLSSTTAGVRSWVDAGGGGGTPASIADMDAGTSDTVYVSPKVLKDITKVGIGNEAGRTSQGVNTVAIGANAANSGQGQSSVAIGDFAGGTSQGVRSVSIGHDCGRNSQGGSAVAIGTDSGQNTQGINSVAIGNLAAEDDQGNNAVGIGFFAGQNTQGESAVAIGNGAGRNSQGANAIAVGTGAGDTSQEANGVHLSTPNFDFQYLPSTKILDVTNTTSDLTFTVNGQVLTSPTNYNSNFNILDDALTNTAASSNLVVRDFGRIFRSSSAAGNVYAQSKHMIPIETYFEVEYDSIGTSNNAITTIICSPKSSGPIWSRGFAIGTNAKNITIYEVTSGTRPRGRFISALATFAGVLSSGDTVRYWTTRDDANNVTVFAQVNGTGTIHSQQVGVVGVGDASNWTTSFVATNLTADIVDVTFNFGFKPFTYAIEAGKQIAALSPAVMTQPFQIWDGSAGFVDESSLDFPIVDSNGVNIGEYIINTTPPGGASSNASMTIVDGIEDHYAVFFASEVSTNIWVHTAVRWDVSVRRFVYSSNTLNLPTAEVTQGTGLLDFISYRFGG